MTQKKRSFEMIVRMQAVKKPLDDERQVLWAELKALLATVSVKEQELRQEIKAVQDRVAPLDILMAKIDRAGKFRDVAGAKALLDNLEGEYNGITN